MAEEREEFLNIEIKRIISLKEDCDVIEQINTSFGKVAKKYRNNISDLYDILMLFLNNNSTRIKYIIFLMMSIVFEKSHEFRVLFCSEIYKIYKLITNDGYWEFGKKLSTKKNTIYHNKLKDQAYNKLVRWCKYYGRGYPQLLEHKNFLKKSLNIDIEKYQDNYDHSVTIVNGRFTVISDRVIEDAKAKTSVRLWQQVCSQLKYSYFDIFNTINQLDECFKMLNLDNLIKRLINDIHLPVENNNIEINITDDNLCIVNTIFDYQKLIKKQFLPLLQRYSKLYSLIEFPLLEESSYIVDIVKVRNHIKYFITVENLIDKIKFINQSSTNNILISTEFIDVNEANEYELILDHDPNLFDNNNNGINRKRKLQS